MTLKKEVDLNSKDIDTFEKEGLVVIIPFNFLGFSRGK